MHSNLLVVDSKKKEKGCQHVVNSNKIGLILKWKVEEESGWAVDKRFSGGFSHEQAGYCETFSLVQQAHQQKSPAVPPGKLTRLPSPFSRISFKTLRAMTRILITSSMLSNAEANSINID